MPSCPPNSVTSLPASTGVSSPCPLQAPSPASPSFWGSPFPHRAPPSPAVFPATRADSVTWNPHKLLMVGLQCSAFLLRDNSVGAPHPEFLPLGCLPGPPH